ncbi:tape measure protein [Fructilactobacillus cliffordii]|uniref:tape measure protein n=1 Tax=Fructilactobacillus cliffordii TaxID=2940299 RepID=UPI002093563F|nr:tape measure protein [Fructilactobacillus cliffordii]USS86499.1 tape measure protein [Fructilactobacillus cliffordii]
MHIGGALKAGMEFDEEQQKMVATWTTLTGHHKDALVMVDDINKLSVATGQSAEQTDELEQKFYHLHSSKDEAHEMTKAMLNMADAVGLNGQQIDAVSQDMTNALSRGKASAGEINQITQYFPMYREELAKSKNVTVQQLNDMVKAGKVSADDMEKVFEHLGNVKYGKAADNMLETMKGAERVIHARVPALIGDIEKPIMNAKSPVTLAVSKWLSDKETDKAFSDLGKSVSKSISTVMNAFGKDITPGSLSKNLNGEIESMAKSVGKFGDFVSSHKKDIQQFFETLKSAGAGGFKVLATEAKVTGEILLPLLEFIDKHQKVMVPLIGSLLAFRGALSLTNKMMVPFALGINGMSNAAGKAKKAWHWVMGGEELANGAKSLNVLKRTENGFKSFGEVSANAIKKVGTAFLNIGKAMLANPLGIAIAAIAAVGVAFVEAYKHIKPFRDFVNGMASWVKKAFDATLKIIVDFFKRLMDTKEAKEMMKKFDVMIKSFQKIWRDTVKVVSDVFKKIVQTIKPALDVIGKMFKSSKGQLSPFMEVMNDIAQIMKEVAREIGKLIGSAIKPLIKILSMVLVTQFKIAFKVIGDLFHMIGVVAIRAFKIIGDAFKIWADVFTGNWKALGKDLVKYIQDIWKMITAIFSNAFRIINDLTGGWLGNIVGWISNAFKGIVSFIKWSWDSIKNIWKSSTDWISGIWNGFLGFIKWLWDHSFGALINSAINGWNTVKSIWKSATDWIGNIWHSFTDDLRWVWDHTFGAIIDKVKNSVESIHHAMVDIARGVIKPINSMLSGLKEGINWVLDKVGAGKISAKWEIAMPGYAKGTKDTHPGGLAKVNDSPDSEFREMFQTPDGEIGLFPNKRNLIVNLPAGTSVLDGKRSSVLAKAMGIPGYANGIGKFVGNITKSISGVFKGIWDKGADLVDMADKILKNPAEFLETVFQKFLGGTSSTISLASDVITHFPSTVAKEGVNWIKGLINKLKDEAGGDVQMGAVGNYNPDQIRRAADEMHVSLSDHMLKVIQSLIQNESGGNAGVTQHGYTDINSGSSATLARGLLQYVPSTFAHYAVSGHNNIFNAYDQLLALFNDSNWASDIHPGGGWGPTGHRRMANGGLIGTHQMIEVAEGNMPEFIIPTDPAKRSRSDELLRQANAALNHDAQPANNDELVAKVEHQTKLVAQLTSLASQILTGQGEQTQTIRSTAQTPRQRYVQDGINGQINNYQPKLGY